MSMALASRRLALDPPTGLPTLGLLAHCPVVKRNLLKQSEDLTNAAWTKTNAGTGTAGIVTAGMTDPLGGTTAFRVQLNLNGGTAIGDTSVISQSVPGLSNPHTISIGMWAKSNTASTYLLLLRDNQSGAVVPILSVTPQWQFFSQLNTATNQTNTNYYLALRGTLGTSDSADILVWHPQVNEGTSLLDYEATSDNQRVINLISGYNAIKYSEQLDNAAWTKTRSSVTANAVANPLDGAVTADKFIIDTTAATTHQLSESSIVTGDGVRSWAVSFYAKAAERQRVGVTLGSGFDIRFKLDTQTATVLGGTSATCVSVGNGWYYCTAVGVPSTVGAMSMVFLLLDESTSSQIVSGTPNGTDGIYLYGAMLNEGATALPYERTMDIGATKDPQYGWAYHLQLGSSSASDTNDPVYLTNLLDPDATDDYVMIPLHLVDRDEWTIVAVVKSKSGMAYDPRAFGVRYDGSASKFLAAIWDHTNTRGNAAYANGGSTTTPNIGASASWAADIWGLIALSFNRLTGALTARQIVNGALATTTATNTGLSTPDVARFLNSAIATGFPMDGGGAYALIYNRALSDAEIMRAYKYMQQAKRETVTL